MDHDDMNAPDLFRRAAEAATERVHAIGDHQWSSPTPCTDWDVRALVNHLVGEALWARELFDGKTVSEVGDRLDGDLLGDHPKAAWDESIVGATNAILGEGAMDRLVNLSRGPTPGRDYIWELFADELIHGWDLARAIGADETLDLELVEACTAWFATMEGTYRALGSIAGRPDIPTGASPQIRLLAMFGRVGGPGG